jgi:RsiW-degrading membrane proteinase PrsW (M82 family)
MAGFLALTYFTCCYRPREAIGDDVFPLLMGMLCTATVSLSLLFLFQRIATGPLPVMGKNGEETLVLVIVRVIGYAYRIVDNPSGSLIAIIFGYAIGVALCEEVCKAVFASFFCDQFCHNDRDGAAVGLTFVCGVGFGIREAILYASGSYNGVESWEIYLIRFSSCTCLHGIWTVITLFGSGILGVVGHALYDICLVTGHAAWANGVAVASVACLWIVATAVADGDNRGVSSPITVLGKQTSMGILCGFAALVLAITAVAWSMPDPLVWTPFASPFACGFIAASVSALFGYCSWTLLRRSKRPKSMWMHQVSQFLWQLKYRVQGAGSNAEDRLILLCKGNRQMAEHLIHTEQHSGVKDRQAAIARSIAMFDQLNSVSTRE